MLVFTKKANISIIYKVATILLMFWITYSNELINLVLLHNLGIPTLPFQKVIFLSLSLLIALELCLKRRKIILPNVLLFSVLFLSFILIEYINADKTSNMKYELINLWLWIFFLASILLNIYKTSTHIHIVIDYFLIAILICNMIILSGIVGIINLTILYQTDSRPMGEVNLNTWSDFSALAIVILISLKLQRNKYWSINNKKINILIIFFFILPIVTGSRGATLIGVFAIIIYLINYYIQKNLIPKLIFTLFVFIIIIIVQESLQFEIANLLIGRRFAETSFQSGRGVQIITSWHNFLSSPWIGVGYENAAASLFHGITRSNFQYTQILASSGIFFTFIYLYYNYKTFGYNLRNLREPFFFFTLSFIFLKYCFRRPDHTFAFLMFLSYHMNILFNLRPNRELENN